MCPARAHSRQPKKRYQVAPNGATVDWEPLIATNRPLLTELAAKVRRTVLFVEKETQGVQIECCKFSYSQLMITFEERMKQI